MKRRLLRTLCVLFALALCFPLAACDMEFGGLLGMLMENSGTPEHVLPPEGDYPAVEYPYPPEIEIETAIEWSEYYTTPPIEIEPDYTYDYTYDYPDTTEEPVYDEITEDIPIDPGPPEPVLFFSFDECYTVIDGMTVDHLFTPGMYTDWNHQALVKDYTAEYLCVRGWVALSSAQLGEIGYCIDHDNYVFDPAFFTQTEQPVLDAAASFGAGSASRIDVMIPIRDLSGTHQIEIVARDEFGYLEVISSFVLDKAVDPNAPVFCYWPADLMPSLVGQVGTGDIDQVAVGGNGEYLTITTGTVGDPWYQLPMVNGSGLVASHIAIKYRTESPVTKGNIFTGSGVGPTGQGDAVSYEMINDGEWHLLILDLSQANAIRDGVINYLRWDMFAGGQNNAIDLSYIAAFNSEQAALDYDASVADRYTD